MLFGLACHSPLSSWFQRKGCDAAPYIPNPAAKVRACVCLCMCVLQNPFPRFPSFLPSFRSCVVVNVKGQYCPAGVATQSFVPAETRDGMQQQPSPLSTKGLLCDHTVMLGFPSAPQSHVLSMFLSLIKCVLAGSRAVQGACVLCKSLPLQPPVHSRRRDAFNIVTPPIS